MFLLLHIFLPPVSMAKSTVSQNANLQNIFPLNLQIICRAANCQPPQTILQTANIPRIGHSMSWKISMGELFEINRGQNYCTLVDSGNKIQYVHRYCSFTVLTTLRDFTLDGRTYYIIQIKQGSNASKNPTCLLLVQCTCDLWFSKKFDCANLMGLQN